MVLSIQIQSSRNCVNSMGLKDTSHFTVRKTPQQNGVAKRMNRTITERAQCLILNARLEKKFWVEAMNMAY